MTPLLGRLRHSGANKKSLFQASTELDLTTSFKSVASLPDTCCLADFGTRLKTLILGIGSNDGCAVGGSAETDDEGNDGNVDDADDVVVADADGGDDDDDNDDDDDDNDDVSGGTGAEGRAPELTTADRGGLPDP